MDLNLFKFDYWTTWYAFFLNAHGHIYARYGVRPARANQDGSLMSVAGLKGVMRKVLDAHKTGKDRRPNPPLAAEPRLPEKLSRAPGIINRQGCLHCHHIWQIGRNESPPFITWRRPDLPKPKTIGFTLGIDLGNVVESVDPAGPAASAGIRVKDEVVEANGVPIYSTADLAWVLNVRKGNAPLAIVVRREGKTLKITL